MVRLANAATIPTRTSSFVAPYAAAADGKRFLINTIVDESNGAPLTLVINWQGLIGR